MVEQQEFQYEEVDLLNANQDGEAQLKKTILACSLCWEN